MHSGSDGVENDLLTHSNNNNNHRILEVNQPPLVTSPDDWVVPQPSSNTVPGVQHTTKNHVFLNDSFDLVVNGQPKQTPPSTQLGGGGGEADSGNSSGGIGLVEGTLIDLVDDDDADLVPVTTSSLLLSPTEDVPGQEVRNHIETGQLIDHPTDPQLNSTVIPSNHQEDNYGHSYKARPRLRQQPSNEETHSDDEDILCAYSADKQHLLAAENHNHLDTMDRESEPLIAYAARGRLASTDLTLSVPGE